MKQKLQIRNCISSDISYFTYFMKFRKLKADKPVVIANWSTEDILINIEYTGTERNCFVWHVYQGVYETVSVSFDSLHGFLTNAGENRNQFFYWDFQQRIFAYGNDCFYLLFVTAEEECPICSKRIYIAQDQKYYQVDALDRIPYVYIQTLSKDEMEVIPITTKYLQLHMLTPIESFFGGVQTDDKKMNINIPLLGKLEKQWMHVGDVYLKPEIWEEASTVTFLNGNGNYILMPEN